MDRFVLVWLVGGLLFRGVIAFWLYPGIDEAYYYTYSVHLDWSYFDHPVLVALTTGFGTWVTGIVSQFTIRLGTLILHTGSLFLLYLTGVKLFGIKAARLTLAIATIIPIFQIGFGVLTLPDSPLIFFWSASLYVAAREFFREPESYRPSYRLAILGILVGLACLGKYHGFILGLGLVGFCLTSSHHRSALLSPWAGLGLGLFVVTLFPLWFWNIQHDWVSFQFQLNRGVPKSSYSLLGVVIAFLSSIAYLFPTMGLPLWWVSLRSLLPHRPSKQFTKDKNLAKKQWLILSVSLPLILGFTVIGGYEPILPTWMMPGFWGITLLLGHQAVHWQQQSRRWVRWWLQGSGLVIGSSMLLVLLHVTTGTFQKSGQYALLGGFLPAKNDPSTELIDIQQLRRGFIESPILQTALQNSSFIFSNGFYLSGIVSMALTPVTPVPITSFGEDMRGFVFWRSADEWVGHNGLYVTLERFHQMPEITDHYRAYFDNVQEIATIPIRRGGAVVERFYVYRTGKLLKPYPLSWIKFKYYPAIQRIKSDRNA
ncbi:MULTISPECIES: ArnT family glycosyltransferase [unclassified Coleofasciculus]|uniref:ArnT family glycosyltransferase n=1 Tax=unclassified Coleofasciculus TaxID=2692782 RepID=UPI002AD39AC9|nr:MULTISPECIES: glycosyltransferase family 39 protein [unclassified Coleofasciculus]